MSVTISELSEATQNVWSALQKWVKEHGYAPSQRQLADSAGVKSPNTIHYHLKKLKEAGLVENIEGEFRSLRLCAEEKLSATKLALLGSVTAGLPQPAVENADGWIEVDASFVKGPSFALRVRGDSMQEAGILEGDIVIVRMQPVASTGEIVVARLGDETTVKYFKMWKGRHYLFPANPNYSPILADGAEIVGKVTGVLRKY